jgi:cytoskeletal protein RodZ
MMRRVVGLSLAGLGTFLIVIAVVLPTLIVSQVIKFPLNEYETATLDATGASYFNAGTGTERSPVNLQATYTIKGDAAKGTSSTAVWNEFSYVEDLTNHQGVEIMTRTFAFNRKNGQLVACCGESINGKPVVQSGLVGYVFPIGTKKQTYEVFDTSLLKEMPFKYSGPATVDGIQTYEFVENVAPTQVATINVPGSLIGSTQSSVAAPEYYSIHLIYDIDPETGALLNVNEHEVQALYNPATNQQALTLFNADLIATPASVARVVALDSSGRNELTLLNTILPIVLGIVGVVALIVGILLVRRPREDVESDPTTPAPELAAVPEEAEPTQEAAQRSVVPGLDDEAPAATAESESAPAETAEATAAEAAAPDAEAQAAAPEAEAPAEAEAEAPAETEAPADIPAAADETPATVEAEAPADDEAPATTEIPAVGSHAASNGDAPAAAAPKRGWRSRGSHAKPAGDPQ